MTDETITPKRPRARRVPKAAVDAAPPATAAPTGRRAGLPARDTPARPAGMLVDEHAALAMARKVVDLASDKKAADIVLIGIGALTTLADYLVICSGGSERQLGAIADGITAALKEEDILAIGARLLPAREALVGRTDAAARPIARRSPTGAPYIRVMGTGTRRPASSTQPGTPVPAAAIQVVRGNVAARAMPPVLASAGQLALRRHLPAR
jgi:hypothetical protein